MGWFTSLFRRGARRGRSSSPSVPFRPGLEPLEDRLALSTSTVYDAFGAATVFAVYDNHALYRYDKDSVQILAHNVLRAHGYRNFDGTIGLIVIYDATLDFKAFDYNSQGATYLGPNIVYAAKAFDREGHLRFDVTYKVEEQFQTITYTDTGAYAVDNGANLAVFIHSYVDRKGKIGIDVSYFHTATTCTTIEYDSIGVRFLAKNATAQRTDTPDRARSLLDFTPATDFSFLFTSDDETTT
jgi:hypothetical protein